jgi:hypothetical protein
MIKMAILTLTLVLGLEFMAQATVTSKESTLYKHDKSESRVTQGFVDPKAAIGKHPNSIPEMDKSEVNCETYPDSCKSSVIVH